MNVVVLGATGRTGRLLVPHLQGRGHTVRVVVRDADRAPADTDVVDGDVRDAAVLRRAVTTGADAVLSALGPRRGDHDLHAALVAVLVPGMRTAGVGRYLGISGAGVTLPTDRKRRRDAVISAAMRVVTPSMVTDKLAEIRAWQSSGLAWTLVRPPRLTDGPPTGRLEHDTHRSTRGTTLSRADLAGFLVDCLEQQRYVGAAPFVATGR